MTDRIEKAYYLKQEELAVLLALQGVQQLYGFRMDMAGNMNKEELHKILFEMARKNLLSVTGRCIEMDTDLSAVLKDLVQAETVLHLTGTEEYLVCWTGHGFMLKRRRTVHRYRNWRESYMPRKKSV